MVRGIDRRMRIFDQRPRSGGAREDVGKELVAGKVAGQIRMHMRRFEIVGWLCLLRILG